MFKFVLPPECLTKERYCRRERNIDKGKERGGEGAKERGREISEGKTKIGERGKVGEKVK